MDMAPTRSAGILLAVSSLPSPYGIGTLGKAAYDFVDFLSASGQKYWQMLPVGPLTYGDSPYQSFSAFAGNPYYIDPDMLIEDGLLAKQEVASLSWGSNPRKVDYGAIYTNRFQILKKAYERGWDRDCSEVEAYHAKNRAWLDDYALFMSLKQQFHMASWTTWPDREIRLRQGDSVQFWQKKLASEVQFFIYLQYLFQKQWDALKKYASKKNIQLIGDLPIYIAMDSSDVWSQPQNYLLDQDNVPTSVAGVPPDAFTADGQLWGNPLYNWEKMASDGFSWWEARMRTTFERFDVARLDHFRGLESYWTVPYGSPTAAIGRWEPGPGVPFIQMLKNKFSDRTIIAEDLGFITPEVQSLLSFSGFPGMKVLQFAFDHREPSDYLPHRYKENCICYTGTHDNNSLRGWLAEADPEDIAVAKAYLGLHEEEGYDWGILRGGMSSVASLFVAQMQDYLGLGKAARMNTPGTNTGNWQWRMLPGEASPSLAQKIQKMTRLFGR